MLKKKLPLVLMTLLLFSQSNIAAFAALGKSEIILRYGLVGGYIGFNPLTSYSYTMLRSILWAPLFTFNETWEAEPWAAEYATDIDPLTCEIKLRDNLFWHDGRPVTSYDYKFTWELLINYPTTQTRFVENIDSIEIVNDKVFRVRLKQPMGGYRIFLTSVAVPVPKHIFEARGLTGENALTYENIPPIGNGPFKFVEYKPGESITFEAFDKFFYGRPKVDKLIVKLFASVDAMTAALVAGEIDVVSDVPWSVGAALLKNPELVISAAEIPCYRSIYINQYPGKVGHPALDDPVVRRAIAMCIDKDGINSLIHPIFTVGWTPITPKWPFFDSEIPKMAPKYNTSEAAALLEAAGYTDRNGDGIREDPRTGKPLIFRLWVYNQYPEEIRAAQLIREGLRLAGMDCEIRAMEAVLWDYVVSPPYDWDLALWGWTVHDPISCWFPYTSKAIPAGWSSSGYHNNTFDELYQALLTASSFNEFLNIQHQLQKHFVKNMVEIVLYHETFVSVWRKEWTGFSNNPCGVFWYGFNSKAFINAQPVTAPAEGVGWGNLLLAVVIIIALVIAVGLIIVYKKRKGGSTEE